MRGPERTMAGIAEVLYLDDTGVYIRLYTFVKTHWTIYLSGCICQM